MAELLLQSIPLKTSSDVDIVKPLKNLIQSSCSGDNTEDYTEALNELSRLRASAIWKVSDKSSLEVIYSYYDRLSSLVSKIPPQEVQIPFKWKDAFDRGSIFGGRRALTVCSLEYERVCVLFNIAAMQSAVAASSSLADDAGQQTAARLLQAGAGALAAVRSAVRAAVHSDPTPDLQPDALQALHLLLLAQAQEVILYKCIKDEMKDGTVAKVAAHGEELYGEAARALAREPARALWERDLLPAATTRHLALGALAQHHRGLAAGAEQEKGEEIARLQLASSLFASAKLSGVELYRAAAAACERRLAAALRDNDFIYHSRVPRAEQLAAIPRSAVARPLPVPQRWGGGPDPFSALAPLAERRQLAAEAARRAELAHAEVDKLQVATQELTSELSSLQLSSLLDCGGEELPSPLRAQSEAVRERGGAAGLQALMAELPDLLHRNKEILDETERMLREESEADDQLRAQFGARWTRSPSGALTESFRASLDKYRQVIDNAVSADGVVAAKFAQHREGIEQLSAGPDRLLGQLPATAPRPEPAPELRELRDRLDRLLADRTQLRTELLSPSPALEELAERVRTSLALQADGLAALRDACATLRTPGGQDGARAERLVALGAAHDAYRELHDNLQEGIKFYNDLTHLLLAFQTKVSDFCFARRTEKEELLKDLTQAASRPASGQEPPRREPPPRPAPAAPPAPVAPLPYPTQAQGMPVPYGGAPYQYYAPPMPALYNPYATLPYPRSGPAPPPGHYYHPPPGPFAAPPPGYYPPPQ